MGSWLSLCEDTQPIEINVPPQLEKKGIVLLLWWVFCYLRLTTVFRLKSFSYLNNLFMARVCEKFALSREGWGEEGGGVKMRCAGYFSKSLVDKGSI